MSDITPSIGSTIEAALALAGQSAEQRAYARELAIERRAAR